MENNQFIRLFMVNVTTEDLKFYCAEIKQNIGDNALRVAMRDDGQVYWSVTERRGDYADETLTYIDLEDMQKELERR